MMEYFSPDYETARARFREAAGKAGVRLDSIELAANGPGGRPLSIDIAWLGAATPGTVILHSSGLHGVEGFAGSAVHLQLLEHPPPLPEETAILIVHILNPYGMAWLRRTNENNVDLNRNFLSEDEVYAGTPDGYEDISGFLNPSRLGFGDFFWLRAGGLLLRHGLKPLTQATVAGQYDQLDGLFFGGKQLEEGPRVYRDYLERNVSAAARIVAIDVHTGLGQYGRDTILTGRKEAARYGRFLGERLRTRDSADSRAYTVRGGIESMLVRVCPGADVEYLCQEMGTYGRVQVLRALRKENYWHRRGTDRAWAAKADLKAMFSPRDPLWETEVVRRGRDLLDRILTTAP